MSREFSFFAFAITSDASVMRESPRTLRHEHADGARLSLCARERIEVRVSTSTAPAAQTRSLVRRCRVPGEPDDSKTAERVGCLLSQQTSAIHSQLSYLPAHFPTGNHPATPHLNPLPAKQGEAEEVSREFFFLCLRHNHACALSCEITPYLRVRLQTELASPFTKGRGLR